MKEYNDAAWSNEFDWVSVRRMLAVFTGGYRFEILLELARSPQNVSALARAIDVSISTVSQNLHDLRSAGLVEGRRCGQQVLYDLSGWCHIIQRNESASLTAEDADGGLIMMMPRRMVQPHPNVDVITTIFANGVTDRPART